VRYLHDAYGNIWFAGDRSDAVIPVSRLVRGRAAVAAAASALVLAPMLMEACGGVGPYAYDGGPRMDATPSEAAAPVDGGQGDAADALEQDGGDVDGSADR
jgi:hypothetical protein